MGGTVPVLMVHPDWDAGTPAPTMIWMHGRTVQKEIDPGRYLRWMRAGVAVCAIDLPGHGERFDADLQDPDRTFDVVLGMINEIDAIADDLRHWSEFDADCMGIGGMSAGGMATLSRLCSPHTFTCTSVEATTGSWDHQRRRRMFRDRHDTEIETHNPLTRLDGWREIPMQAFHSRLDEWVGFDGQEVFINALRAQYDDPNQIELVVYDETGAPYEHAGFGRMAADAKDRQRDFLVRTLCRETPSTTA